VSELAKRAEDIAAHLVSDALKTTATNYDVDGRQSAVDFMLEWPDKRRAALEVTLVTEPQSSAWQGMAAREGWRWPATSGWEFRLSGPDLRYRRTREVVLRAVELCNRWNVDTPQKLPAEVLESHPDLAWLEQVGALRRTPFKPGVVLLPEVRAEFVEASPADFTAIVEEWLLLPHMPRHLEKLRLATAVVERHLFVVAVDEVLPARFFTDDFDLPRRGPSSTHGIDGIWVWSNYWHRYLSWRAGTWCWLDFPRTNVD
jgi:hypothetical protein